MDMSLSISINTNFNFESEVQDMVSDIAGLTYDCKNADALADFYVNLLGWEKYF